MNCAQLDQQLFLRSKTWPLRVLLPGEEVSRLILQFRQLFLDCAKARSGYFNLMKTSTGEEIKKSLLD